MIVPTIGRVVWFWNNRALWEQAKSGHAEPHAALIAATDPENPRMVNLGCFDSLGRAYGATNVVLLQDADEPPKTGSFCEWMPFQKGQAGKTAELQAQLNAQSQSTESQTSGEGV